MMNKLAAAWLAIGGAWLLAAACKSEPVEAERVSAQSFGAVFAKALCDNAARCCSLSKFAFDHTNCEGRLEVSLQAQVDDVLSDPVDYDAEAAGECLAEVDAQQACGASVLEFPACDGLFVGRLEDGQPCSRDVTCKSRWCAPVGDTDALACAPLQDFGPIPQPIRKVGESCDFDSDCVEGLFCQGLCEAPHPNGASCADDNQCRSGACLGGECVESALTEEACTSGGADF